VPQNFLSVNNVENFQHLVADVRAGKRIVSVSGLNGSAKALTLAALQQVTGRRLAIVGLRGGDLEDLENDLSFFYRTLHHRPHTDQGEAEIFTLPASESDPYSGTSPHADILERRALALWRLVSDQQQNQSRIILLSTRALLRRYVALEETRQAGIMLKTGEELPLEYLTEHLMAIGYVRSDPVAGIGEFSLRGGILDFYSPGAAIEGAARPVRVEFWGDTIDSLREFDPETQRSTCTIEQCEMVPMRDERAGQNDFRRWSEQAREHWRDERFARALRDRTAFADEGEAFQGWEYLLPLTRPLSATVFDYLRDAVLVIDEPSEIEKQVRSILDEIQLGFDRADSIDELALAPEKLFLTPDELRHHLDATQRIELRLLGSAALSFQDELNTETISSAAAMKAATEADVALPSAFMRSQNAAPLFLFAPAPGSREIEIPSRSVRRWHGRVRELAEDLRQQMLAGHQTFFVLPSTGVADRLREMLREYDIESAEFKVQSSEFASNEVSDNAAASQPALKNDSTNLGLRTPPNPRHFLPCILIGDLSAGFSLPASQLTFYTESDIFDEAVHVERPRPQKRTNLGAFISDFRDLKIGDYVVHIDHGIGQFQGLIQIETENSQTPGSAYARMTGIGNVEAKSARREFMLLTYAEGTKLYVPVERLDLVQKFSSAEGNQPSLDKLGGIAWAKTKARAKRAMRDMAEELLRLYAERRLVKGYAFSGDSPWQQEFEDAFPYELTPDQSAAIIDVKKDMETPSPMDRLLCGDVGYGKTEVAMRAAFKAVMDGRQVAILAPTTVLAYQHFQTFRSRFTAFPATIELLSRFRSPKEQKEVLAAVESGSVDILIGTHRILSRDLTFKNLGLVIVDEEQRFGVAHKERLKQLKKRVDVLTMSATPIPRTLNMSLMGMRDMSVIETPPRDRLAIQTNVVAFGENVVRTAIEQELQRQGQVFFVHNRVESIEEIAALLKRIVPEARYIIAHGQMGEKEMENAVLDFVAHQYDVLVATTIIENGIDIPRANTIIINRADTYGLSQLYQLRGRVGRSNRRAYAYLLIPSERELTPIARRRLAAIREFSDLGAGFRIAALDLELRGAGNLLGGQQSGHIDAIGFDLYTQMLERTIAELRGEDIADEASTQLNIGVDTRIPDEYVFDMSQRLRTYKRIASARSDEELEKIHDEISDRYGRLPESVENLFAYSRARRLAERLGILTIDRTGESLAIRLGEKSRVEPERLLELLRVNPDAGFTPNGVLKLKLAGAKEGREIFAALESLLKDLQR
jgi:transcription-repair coupling factor (superfamily II helicase)